MDTRSIEQRRRIMQSVGQKDTGPEIAVRRALHRVGYRFRLHVRSLPGRPDIVFPTRRKAIFIHGCFWHGHGCKKGRLPKSRPDYWVPKIEGNKARDERAIIELRQAGWESMVIWQCELAEGEGLISRVTEFLGPAGKGQPRLEHE